MTIKHRRAQIKVYSAGIVANYMLAALCAITYGLIAFLVSHAVAAEANGVLVTAILQPSV